MSGKYRDRIIDDHSAMTRAFGDDSYSPKWGKNGLDLERDPFSDVEEQIAKRIGLEPLEDDASA